MDLAEHGLFLFQASPVSVIMLFCRSNTGVPHLFSDQTLIHVIVQQDRSISLSGLMWRFDVNTGLSTQGL